VAVVAGIVVAAAGIVAVAVAGIAVQVPERARVLVVVLRVPVGRLLSPCSFS
jgi:hypothetical protein